MSKISSADRVFLSGVRQDRRLSEEEDEGGRSNGLDSKIFIKERPNLGMEKEKLLIKSISSGC